MSAKPKEKKTEKAVEPVKQEVPFKWYATERFLENFIVQLESQDISYHPVTGAKTTVGKDIAVKFDYGMFHTNDPALINAVGSHEELVEKMDAHESKNNDNLAKSYRECSPEECLLLNTLKKGVAHPKTFHKRINDIAKAMTAANYGTVQGHG